MQARNHFWGLREACPDLIGYALFDRLNLPDRGSQTLAEHSWRKMEIENYFCAPEVLTRWSQAESPLFQSFMTESVTEVENALRLLGRVSPWEGELKVSDVFLPPLFQAYYGKAGAAAGMPKSDYHFLIDHIEPDEIDPEVISVLDAILDVANKAKPRSGNSAGN